MCLCVFFRHYETTDLNNYVGKLTIYCNATPLTVSMQRGDEMLMMNKSVDNDYTFTLP